MPEPIVPVLDTAKSAEILRKLQPDSDLRAYTYIMHGIWESVWDHENSHIDPHFKTSAAPVGVMGGRPGGAVLRHATDIQAHLSVSNPRRDAVAGVPFFAGSQRKPASFCVPLRLHWQQGSIREVSMNTQVQSPAAASGDLQVAPAWRAWIVPVLCVAGWFLLYGQLQPATDAFMRWLSGATGMAATSHLYSAVSFFAFEVPKVLMLLALIVFVVGVSQTFFTPEKTRAILAGKRQGVGNVLAATLGIVTPFCSCSAVPLFIGFLTAGVPLGVTFSFLVSAPMVNEVALALLFGMFGWKIAAIYLGLGLAVAIIAGAVIGRMNPVNLVEPWVFDIPAVSHDEAKLDWQQRFAQGWKHVREIVLKVAPYIVAGVGVGAWIHGYVPEDFMAHLMGKSTWWSVPLAVLIGVPMYSNAAGIIPVVQALLGKGAALGTTLAFMMAVTALSFPEFMILRKVMKPKLIALFAGVVTVGIIIVGYVFNAVM
ncbi:Permease (modular protein) [Thiomonas sp. X19]|uniref:permease n=1 Tax=Thiomonas sp. X19 TaxID=1050370 RepID=UPI000B6750C1|nr:permease [Thiomonas sp. X19]SCC93359.1 Permease (modular protein) [Thiomonas sp. X19]